ncbi:MAG TPA: hypothetical protein VF178_10685 [Gemmatimonadaceae bacterium]
MRPATRTSLLALVAIVAAWPAAAQQGAAGPVTSRDTTDTAATESTKPAAKPAPSLIRPLEIQRLRPPDQRGLNMFETPKTDTVPFEGFKLSWGAAFTQQFQSLSHENTAAERLDTDGTNLNELQDIGAGFNNATANLYLNAQLAPGIRVALTSYLSSRHHNETWVKDGYLLVDESPLDVPALHTLMKYVTLKLGHFEINYGDAHFRRTDNGNAMYNPFVGNLIMDAFTTQIGGEVYVRTGSFMVMSSVTGGELRGNVTQPDSRAPAFIQKIGYDRQVTEDLRIRLTGSTFQQARAISNTLYGGDRAGSRYYWVLENTKATESANFTSGLLNPGFRSKVKAYMVNPFVKYQGLELFGVIEQAEGRAANEASNREWTQYAADALFRFLPREQLYVGARYNTAEGALAGMTNDVRIDRTALAAGWFITPGVLLKGEWVTQKYHDFPATDIRSGGRFKGFIVEGVVAF